MKSKNELFLDAVDYLIDEGLADDQGDLAQKAGLGPNLISRVRNGRVKSVSDDSIRALVAKFNLNIDFFRGKSEDLTRYDQESENTDRVPDHQLSEIPDFIQRLFDESVRMQTRNEMLERQCEKLIAELRDSKDNNEKFLSELRKSNEYNDTLVAELKISRVQNDNLISELRETKKHNAMLATKLEAAIDGIEGMKNQLAMMVGAYATPHQPTFSPLSVNDDAVMPEGLIRGEHQAFTEEYAKSANKALDSQPRRV